MKEKKVDRIYGKELKSEVMRGRLEVKIISMRLVRKLLSITGDSFYRTIVNNPTNYWSLH